MTDQQDRPEISPEEVEILEELHGKGAPSILEDPFEGFEWPNVEMPLGVEGEMPNAAEMSVADIAELHRRIHINHPVSAFDAPPEAFPDRGVYSGGGIESGRTSTKTPPWSNPEAFHCNPSIRHQVARAIIKRDRKALYRVKVGPLSGKLFGRPAFWKVAHAIVPGVKVEESRSVVGARATAHIHAQSRLRKLLMWWAERRLTPGVVLLILRKAPTPSR